jgi:cupin 2 domain-containing protein
MNPLSHGSLFDDLPPPGAPEHFAALAAGAGTRIERIVSRGHSSPPGFWYDQEENELVLLISGEAELEFDPPELASERTPHGPRTSRSRPALPGRIHLETGEWLVIPAHARHRVTWTLPEQETIWLAVFYR